MPTVKTKQIEKKNKAYTLSLEGRSLKEISKKIGINYNTVSHWARTEKWKEKEPVTTTKNRYAYLINKHRKTEYEWKEVFRLQELLQKF